MSAAAAPKSSAGPPMKRKHPFAAPPEPERRLDGVGIAADDEKGQVGGGKGETGKGKVRKEGSGILTSRLFSELPISEPTARAITEMNYTRLTHIQARSIQPLLEGRDVMGHGRI